MHMKSRRLAVMAVALIAALGAAFLARSVVANKEPVETVVEPQAETTEVLVAARDVRLGASVDSTALKWQPWPKTAVSSRLITRDSRPDAVQSLTGAVVRTSLIEGEPIDERKLVKADQGGFMAAILPKGMRAISVRISPETGAGGFILPNDRVDVLLTRRVTRRNSEEHVTETVLTNVRVLAIDQTYEENGEGEKVAIGKTATLELKPDQAEVLALAEALGDISLALRSITENADLRLGENGPHTADGYANKGGGRGNAVTLVRYGVATSVNGR